MADQPSSEGQNYFSQLKNQYLSIIRTTFLNSCNSKKFVSIRVKYLIIMERKTKIAAEDGKQAMNIALEGNDDLEIASSDWVLVTSRPGFFDQPNVKKVAQEIKPVPGLRMWTDDYSNLYRILR